MLTALLHLLLSTVAFWLLQAAVYAVLVVVPRRRLRHRVHERVHLDDEQLASFEAVTRKRLRSDFAHALPYFDAYAEDESCLWLNAIFARLFCQLSEDGFLRELMVKKMAVQVDLNDLALDDVSLADAPPIVKAVKVFRRAGHLASFFAVADIAYNPATTVTFRGSLTTGLPFDARATVSNFKARVYLRFARHESILSWAFLHLPTFDLDLDGSVGGRECPASLLWFLRNVFVPIKMKRTVVIPHCTTFRFGRKRVAADTASIAAVDVETASQAGSPVDGVHEKDQLLIDTNAKTLESSSTAASIGTPRSGSAASITAATSATATRLAKSISTYREHIKEQMPSIKEKVSTSAMGVWSRIQEKRGVAKKQPQQGGVEGSGKSVEQLMYGAESAPVTAAEQPPLPLPPRSVDNEPPHVPEKEEVAAHTAHSIRPPSFHDQEFRASDTSSVSISPRTSFDAAVTHAPVYPLVPMPETATATDSPYANIDMHLTTLERRRGQEGTNALPDVPIESTSAEELYQFVDDALMRVAGSQMDSMQSTASAPQTSAAAAVRASFDPLLQQDEDDKESARPIQEDELRELVYDVVGEAMTSGAPSLGSVNWPALPPVPPRSATVVASTVSPPLPERPATALPETHSPTLPPLPRRPTITRPRSPSHPTPASPPLPRRDIVVGTLAPGYEAAATATTTLISPSAENNTTAAPTPSKSASPGGEHL